MSPRIGWSLALGMSLLARRFVSGMELRVEGSQHVPGQGPALLVCRHYHNFYDGAALLAAVPRPVRILVALDWARNQFQRMYMEALCRLAEWPVVLRAPGRGNPYGGAYLHRERFSYARNALRYSLNLLKRGEILAIFPEGYPMIDPVAHCQRALWPSFECGYLSIALQASRLGVQAPLVPTGLTYAGSPEKPYAVTVRFGVPERIEGARQRRAVAGRLQSKVRELSA